MATIDLGEPGVAAGGEIAPAELPTRTRRALLAAGIAFACLIGAAGSSPAEPGLAAALWNGQISLIGFALGERSLYLAEPTGRAVVARDVFTGRLRWRLEIDEVPVAWQPVSADLAAVLTHVPTPGGAEPTVSLVDERDGQVRAVTTGVVLGPAATGRRLILTHQRAYEDCPGFGVQCWDVFAVDPATGVELDRVSFPYDAAIMASVVDGAVQAYGSMDRTGSVRVYDADTGRVIDQGTVAADEQPAEPLLLPDLLVTAHRAGDAVVMTAYRRGPLTRQWSTPVPVSEEGYYPTWWLAGSDCGPAVCLRADGRTVVLDRSTGRISFQFRGEIVAAVGQRVLLAYAAGGPAQIADQPLLLLDASTGATRESLSNTSLVPWTGGRGRALLVRQGRDRTGFLILHGDGHLDILGSVPGSYLHCQARDVVLACSDPPGNLRVWRLPPPVG